MGPPTKALWLNITWSPGRRLILQTWAAGKLQDTLEENDSRWPARGRGGMGRLLHYHPKSDPW